MPPWDADTETISSVSVTETTPETGEEDLQALFQDDIPAGWEEEAEESPEYDGNPGDRPAVITVALEGYRKQVENTSHMILMAFDAATTGRLSFGRV